MGANGDLGNNGLKLSQKLAFCFTAAKRKILREDMLKKKEFPRS